MQESLEEILEATWKASEINEYSVEAIRKKCAIDVNDDDLLKLEEQGYITRSGSNIPFSAAGKSRRTCSQSLGTGFGDGEKQNESSSPRASRTSSEFSPSRRSKSTTSWSTRVPSTR